MTTTDNHDAHGDATLSLTTDTEDGGKVFQSWTICACNVPGLRAMLGEPHNESISTAEQVQTLAHAALEHGGIQFGGSRQ